MWYVIAAVIVYILYKFITAANEDNNDVRDNPLHQRYAHFFRRLNDAVFDGEAQLNQKAPHIYTLYKSDSNKIIIFKYAMGSMDVKWMYKYYQKELVYERTFNNIKNISVFAQDKMADELLVSMSERIKNHIESVNREITPERLASVLGIANSEINFSEPSTGLNLTYEDKVAIVSMMTTIATIDEHLDRRESKVITSHNKLLGIEIGEYLDIIKFLKSSDYGIDNALEHVSGFQKSIKDIILMMMHEIAIADEEIHNNEAALMTLYRLNLGYESDEMLQVISKYQKLNEYVAEI